MNTRISNSLMLVDGKWEGAADGRLIQVENPAKRTIIGEVPRAGAAEIDRAVRAAAKAFESWKLVQPRERGRLLMKIADAMDAESEAIGRLIATETGNALRTQSRPEAKGAADLFRYFGGLASEVKGETVPLGEHVLSYTRREPIGVVGAIIPWNSAAKAPASSFPTRPAMRSWTASRPPCVSRARANPAPPARAFSCIDRSSTIFFLD